MDRRADRSAKRSVRKHNLRLLLMLALWGCPAARTAGQNDIPLLPQDSTTAFRLNAPNGAAVLKIVPAQGPGFDSALQVQTLRKPANRWDIQLSAETIGPIARNDLLYAVFHLRRVAGSDPDLTAVTELVVERNGVPYTKSQERAGTLSAATWTRFAVPFLAAEDYAAGDTAVRFRLGFDPQTLEIGGVSLLNYQKSISRDRLLTVWPYAGEEPDAPWRTAARDRIERYRKGDLTVLVQHADGQPVSGASVVLEMTAHLFGFGTAINSLVLGNSSDALTYQSAVRNLFNKAVIENDLKWPNWESNRQRGNDEVAWLINNGLAVRGHNLLWPSWKYLPSDVQQLAGNPDALRARVDSHVLEEAAALAGQLNEWDVLNEAYANHNLQDILGQYEMVRWFQLARSSDPYAQLYINDYGILSAGVNGDAHQNAYYSTIQYLLANGAPLDGIGLQSHFGWTLTPPPTMLRILDRFGGLGPVLQGTELDINIDNEQIQADFLRDYMTIMFSHPSVSGVVMWGFWDGAHWLKNAPLLRKDWSWKPSGLQWWDLVYNQWWTRAQGASDVQGQYRARGFQGSYNVAVTVGGQTYSTTTFLPSEGVRVIVTVP